MTRNVKISLLVVGAFALLVAGLLFATRPDAPPSDGAAGGARADALAPADAPRLNEAPNASATLVEFLDFQCPGCAQLQPIMGQLAQQYGDQVEFVIRDFPLPMHPHAEAAAVAAEAAHQQGQFVPMYERLFQNQQAWAEQPDPTGLFRGYAEEIGLDMAAYDAAVADPATLEKVNADKEAGAAAGVQGTPTIFVNGEQVQVNSVQDITDALDAAVGR